MLPQSLRRSMRLSQLGELGLLAELERRGLVHGIGDDAAALDGGIVLTQDALVEGVHFRLDWISWRELGFRAAAVNVSDLSSSGATRRGPSRSTSASPRSDAPSASRAGRALGRATASSSLGRSARAAPPSAPAGMRARRSASPRVGAWPGTHTP